MGETIKDIKERRSCRSYQKRQISEEDLQVILEAGTYAPTGRNAQSPLMVVVQDPETIAQLARMNAQILGNPGADPFFGAPTVIVVFADGDMVTTGKEDASLVLGNLMLAAHAVGAASCWIHRAKEEFESGEGRALKKKWGVPERFYGVGHCILGYADGPLPEAKPRKEGYVIRV